MAYGRCKKTNKWSRQLQTMAYGRCKKTNKRSGVKAQRKTDKRSLHRRRLHLGGLCVRRLLLLVLLVRLALVAAHPALAARAEVDGAQRLCDLARAARRLRLGVALAHRKRARVATNEQHEVGDPD